MEEKKYVSSGVGNKILECLSEADLPPDIVGRQVMIVLAPGGDELRNSVIATVHACEVLDKSDFSIDRISIFKITLRIIPVQFMRETVDSLYWELGNWHTSNGTRVPFEVLS